MSHTLPALAYAYDALEPHIDALTMEIHHSRHHQTYITNLNVALEGAPELAALPVDELLARFDSLPLTVEELKQDCLCYMQYEGKPVKASRLFAGNEHDVQAQRIAKHFGLANSFYREVRYNPYVVAKLLKLVPDNQTPQDDFQSVSLFGIRTLAVFESAEQAYHQLILDLIKQQVYSINLVLSKDVKRIFVDGGFSKNDIYMHLLAKAYPNIEVFASIVAQASAMGAALAIHHGWNSKPIPTDLISLTYYASR